jgi:tetratricopeptide (TPR) repeat protein
MAIVKLEEVLQLRPDYARPFCGIAQGYYELALRGVGVSAATVAGAKARAQQAAVLDPQLTQAHGCIAALSVLEWNFNAAETSFQHALKLGEHAATYRQYALYLVLQNRFDESWSYLQRAQQMDAFSHRQKIAWARFFHISRRYSELDNLFPQRLVTGQLPLEACLLLALTYVELGRMDEAKKIAREARHRSGEQPAIAALVAEALARCGESSQANELVRDLALVSPIPGISKFRQSLLAIALGDAAAAITFLSEAHENREPELIWFPVDPRLESLRGHPRLAPLAQSVAAAPAR